MNRSVTRHTGIDAASIADTELSTAISKTAQGDRQAFERLYRLTCVKLLSVSRRVVPDLQDAEEALQNAYINVWRNAGGFDDARGRPMTWLITIVHRCAIDQLRRRRAGGSAQASAMAAATMVQTVTDPRGSAQLAICLRALDRADELLLRTAFYEGFTYVEIAERSATPLATVKSRARRALSKLAECLQ